MKLDLFSRRINENINIQIFTGEIYRPNNQIIRYSFATSSLSLSQWHSREMIGNLNGEEALTLMHHQPLNKLSIESPPPLRLDLIFKHERTFVEQETPTQPVY